MVTNSIPPGTFTPAPQRASPWTMVLAQGRIESKLMLQHGEQILLNIIIPVVILVATSFLPLLGDATINDIVPMVFAVAATSAGFTGQAISLAFDRRYGALKRTGASGAPKWTIIVGKILGVLAMTTVQLVIISLVAFAVGWRVSLPGAIMGYAALFIGVFCFSSLGLLMGGSMRSEIVLGLANLIWMILIGIAGLVVYLGIIEAPALWIVVPTVALTTALGAAFQGSIHLLGWAVLVGWAIVGTLAAVKWFRFDE
ncbi:ABC transporter permease [Corynebacterium cystitidis]|uniref:ABC-2 type transport system permease protein n=1 Tax=Corynebacterium cystitidis DSM 20524 TaxID=1121357 RepID=A0A1H9PJJ1_9CORY|nr:ABC transporter permease [Corynebacterium cystitidis]WJY82470.1 ABC-2 type transporter [Corynebacterium cystitidis DSM 20524]SER48382.1 ABC-2 type transport system permease protein [Corynebacterium cystitidis DSM 20524]SNV75344.1 ABC transport system, permease [Corynebacterium cystitidis]